MKHIQTITVGSGGASTIEFTSIPQSYTDLLILGSVRMSNASVLGYNTIRFNSDSGANYSYVFLNGTGTSLFATITTTATFTFASVNGNSATSNVFGNYRFYIPNYTASAHKTASSETVSENNASDAYMDLTASTWRNTNAITTITINDVINSANFLQYSSISLYGITKA